MSCSVCNERPVRYKKTLECANCYNRRYYHENRAAQRRRYNEYQNRRRESAPDRTAEMPEFDLTARIAYSTAHTRVAYWRGRASRHTCSCGSAAREWAYRGDSQHEQLVEACVFGRPEKKVVAISPDPMDYDPMCRPCHVRHDRARAKTATR